MKNFKLLTVLAFTILFSNFAFAQSRSDIIGKWEIDTTETVALMNVEKRSQLDSLDDLSRDQLLNGLARQRFIFNADSTFLMGSHGAQFYDGKWELISDELRLSFYNGANTSQQVAIPSADVIILIVTNSSSFFTSIYLKQSPTN